MPAVGAGVGVSPKTAQGIKNSVIIKNRIFFIFCLLRDKSKTRNCQRIDQSFESYKRPLHNVFRFCPLLFELYYSQFLLCGAHGSGIQPFSFCPF